jgi:alkaline phosphatase D
MTRRGFLSALTMAGAHALVQPMSTAWAQGNKAPALVTSDNMRPGIPYGVASGDITHHSAIIWSRADRPARLMVEYATTESMRDAHRIPGPAALEATDFTAKLDLIGLPAGQRIFYRVYFEDLATPKHYSEPVTGSFLTAPLQKRDLHIMWSGDTAGQGFGINPDWGGMKIYHTMHQMQPDLFIHSGDYIYADGPIEAEVALDDGGIWKNLTTPEKAKVAETLAEFRGNYAYNLLDAHVRRFNAAVSQLVQWDDHETLTNWYPGEQLLDDDRYTVKSASLLAARGKRALFEYTPIRDNLMAPERIHRAFSYGTLGAGPFDAFLRVASPLAIRGYVSAVVLSFAHTLGEFGVVLMVGGNIPGSTRVVSIAVYEHVERIDYAQAHALSIGLLVFSFVVLLAVYATNRGLRIVRA